LNKKEPSKRITSVDALKGIAALAVTWFHFTDGYNPDHWEGCLHDTKISHKEPHRNHGLVQFYNDIIASHADIQLLENCYSLNVLKHIEQT
jgi:peptidoglycan/LPS O-acetylase OafA/YrhL